MLWRGQCVLTAPEVFDQDDADGVVLLLTGPPAPEHVGGRCGGVGRPSPACV
jgi:hypothetical protein